MLSRVEAAARVAGCLRFLLRAYLKAVPLYRAAGYSGDAPGVMLLPGGAEMPVIFMRK